MAMFSYSDVFFYDELVRLESRALTSPLHVLFFLGLLYYIVSQCYPLDCILHAERLCFWFVHYNPCKQSACAQCMDFDLVSFCVYAGFCFLRCFILLSDAVLMHWNCVQG